MVIGILVVSTRAIRKHMIDEPEVPTTAEVPAPTVVEAPGSSGEHNLPPVPNEKQRWGGTHSDSLHNDSGTGNAASIYGGQIKGRGDGSGRGGGT